MEKNIEALEKLKKIENINYIGTELKFEREYYNYIHNTNLRIDMHNSTESAINHYIKFELDEEYENLFDTNFSLEVINTIEDNDYTIFKEKGENISKKTVYSPDTHYFKIFIMLKFYGFLNDYNIFKLLEKYNINPKNEEMKKEVEIIKQKCKIEYEENKCNFPFNLENCLLSANPEYLINFINSDIKPKIFFSNTKDGKIIKRTHTYNGFKEIMLNNFKTLSCFEKKCKSLDFGKETCFIDDVINNNISYIEYESIKKILEYLELKNSDLYNVIIEMLKYSPLPHRQKPFYL